MPHKVSGVQNICPFENCSCYFSVCSFWCHMTGLWHVMPTHVMSVDRYHSWSQWLLGNGGFEGGLNGGFAWRYGASFATHRKMAISIPTSIPTGMNGGSFLLKSIFPWRCDTAVFDGGMVGGFLPKRSFLYINMNLLIMSNSRMHSDVSFLHIVFC